jgi:uncharacterized protein
VSDFGNVTAPPAPPVGSATQEDRTLALLTHLSGIVASIIMPLVIWLIHKDKPDKAWLVDQSKEALNFQITVLIAFVICMVLAMILIGAVLAPLVWGANIVFCILAGVKANAGEAYRYPFALRLIS